MSALSIVDAFAELPDTRRTAAHFQAQQRRVQLNKGHGRIEKRTLNISRDLSDIPDFPGLRTLMRVVSERQVHRAFMIEHSSETRY